MKWQVKTLGGFLRRVAIDAVRFGYVYYSVRTIPAGKDVRAVEQRLARYYSITPCRVTRMRRRQAGEASMVMVRLEHVVVLLATPGRHRFFDEDKPVDIRTTPLHVRGYSIGVRGGKPLVQVAPRRWKAIRRLGSAIALHNETKVADFMKRVSPFSFPGVVRQKVKLLAEINRRRKRAGLPVVQVELWGRRGERIKAKG